MSGIPAWAVPGARVVLIDASPGEADGPHAARERDICIIDRVDMVRGTPACLCHEENGRWTMPELTWARLSRFRPVTAPKSEAEDPALFRQWLPKSQPVDA